MGRDAGEEVVSNTEHKIGDTFKYRLDQQHMWFEVVEVMPDRYRCKLLNEPVKQRLTMPNGKVVAFHSDYSHSDVIEIGKQELADYLDARKEMGLPGPRQAQP